MTSVGFLGTGHIAAPMARALARGGHQVTVSERNAEVAASLVAEGLGITAAPNRSVLDRADIVFLCLRPAVWQGIVAPLSFRADQQVVSVMSGIPLADLAAACAPASRISATIPYGFIEHGACPLPVVGDAAAIRDLFGAANLVLPQEREEALTDHFAASALASGVLEMLDTAAGWLGDQTGDRAQAETYVLSLIAGILAHLPKDGAGRLAAERDALASPNTLNLQMLDGLRAARAFDDLPDILGRIAASMREPR